CCVICLTALISEEFKVVNAEDLNSVSDINLKEKDEEEAKKCQRLNVDFSDLSRSIKTSSNWEDCLPLLEDIQEYRSTAQESEKKDILEDYLHICKKRLKQRDGNARKR
ncbi:hypothetical protein C5167_039925, partial [Papaver somniferum]